MASLNISQQIYLFKLPQFILNTASRFNIVDVLLLITGKKTKIKNISELLVTTNRPRSRINFKSRNSISNSIRLLNNPEYIFNNVFLQTTRKTQIIEKIELELNLIIQYIQDTSSNINIFQPSPNITFTLQFRLILNPVIEEVRVIKRSTFISIIVFRYN